MTQFVRVRDKSTKAEYDVAIERASAFPDDFTVIDPEPVSRPRAASFPKKTVKPKADPDTSKSVGDNRKDEDNG